MEIPSTSPALSDVLLLKPKEAAKRLSICLRTLRELTNETEEIPVVRIGKAVRYDVADGGLKTQLQFRDVDSR
jgi:hypothetical protein